MAPKGYIIVVTKIGRKILVFYVLDSIRISFNRDEIQLRPKGAYFFFKQISTCLIVESNPIIGNASLKILISHAIKLQNYFY